MTQIMNVAYKAMHKEAFSHLLSLLTLSGPPTLVQPPVFFFLPSTLAPTPLLFHQSSAQMSLPQGQLP